jgi:hypothetical protein
MVLGSVQQSTYEVASVSSHKVISTRKIVNSRL